jgi:hypothetical protein
MTEAERAAWLHEQGQRVVQHRGRWWTALRAGFWRPVHLLARLSAAEATRPAAACWGFQAPLRPEDAGAANATAPMHWIDDLEAFGEHGLSSNRRQQLRKARRQVEIVEATGPALLRDQGYAVLVSSQRRTGYGKLRAREEYVDDLERSVRPGRRFVLAGLVGGRLGGYVDGFAVGATAYLDHVVIATEVLGTQIGIGLQFAFVESCRRSDGVREVVHGLHAPEDESLSTYKQRIGFPVRHVPARLWVVPGALPLLRRAAPAVYYRWTGRAS